MSEAQLIDFPCSNINYKNITLEGEEIGAHFTNYNQNSMKLSFQILNITLTRFPGRFFAKSGGPNSRSYQLMMTAN